MEIKTRFEGRELKARSEFINGVLWIHFEGRTFAVDPRESTRKGRGRAGANVGTGDVVAPMPGKITKILKAVGDKASRGEAILVMEAMKMEYTLKAEIDGEIAEISCQTGDQVNLGQALVKLQEAKP